MQETIMHKLVLLYLRPNDPGHFRNYYVKNHLPLAAVLPGLQALRYSLDLAALEGEAPYFAVFEADFADRDALGAAIASPQGQAALADIPKYATGGVVVLHYPVQEGVD
jgi:uncharacterized protein (TIGR02118 family)